jgi:hypothetical protein
MNELDKKMQEYARQFDDGFPMIPLGWGRSETEIIEIIDKCLKENKDVYELGYIENNSDIDY